MAKGKKGAPGRKPKAPPGGGRGSLRSSFVPSEGGAQRSFRLADGNGEPTQSTFSLREEARNTERQHSFWSSDLKLRHNKVNFVSAGDYVPKTLADGQEGEEEQPAGDSDRSSRPLEDPVDGSQNAFAGLNLDGAADMDEDTDMNDPFQGERQFSQPMGSDGAVHGSPEGSQAGDELFVVDVVGAPSPIPTRLAPPVIRSTSPTPSDSSEEVILFSGRKKGSVVSRTPSAARGPERLPHRPRLEEGKNKPRTTSSPDRPGRTSILIDDGELNPQARGLPSSTATKDPFELASTIEASITASTAAGTPPPVIDLLSNGASGSKDKKKRKAGKRVSKKRTSDALLADYIENMQESGDLDGLLQNSAFNMRELGGNDTDEWQDFSEGVDTDKEPKANKKDEFGWGPSELQDFDDLSTSDEVLGIVQDILSKRERTGGTQYLVVSEGYTVDDAKWIPASSLTLDDTMEKIRLFEEEEKLIASFPMDSEDSEDEDSDDVDSSDGESDLEEDLKDEQDLIDRKLARTTDESIARLLAKQEELGMGSDELLLFDDVDEDDEDDDDDEAELRASTRSRKAGFKAQGRRRPRGEFPSANLMADVLEQDPYNGFDVMDHERPSLKRKPKGRRGALPFELSDSDQEAYLQSAWDNDRAKKKMKKREREELRAQGLLGKSNKNKADMKAKYKEGMTMDEIKDEIKEFLIFTQQSLALPPMDKRDRKLVHEIANAFNLKSKSAGAGKKRFPVLYKTSRSTVFDEDSLGVIESRLNQRRFIPRMDVRGKKSTGFARRNGGGAASAAVGYRDGEVVGATAPELGVENRGRAMLEKMGWSTGTALGALNNKGILQPVAHVVKTTKAGLG